MLRWQRCVVAALAAGLLIGCAGTSPPTRYYLLQPMPGTAPLQHQPGSEAELTLGIGPVALPDYLDRQQIVTLLAENRTELAEYDRWAEPLKENFIRVLKENLATILDTPYILQEPWSISDSVDYRLEIEVIRFDADTSNTAVLAARWFIVRQADDVLLLTGKSTHTAAVKGSDYMGIVSSLNQVLEDFSRQIGGQIRNLNLEEKARQPA